MLKKIKHPDFIQTIIRFSSSWLYLIMITTYLDG